MTRFKRMLVAVDLEERAAAYVLESARQLVPEAEITLVHVLERSGFYNLGDASFAMVDDLQNKMTTEIRNYLERLAAAHGAADHDLLEGHAATMIQQHAEAHGHDLIVLGTHGRHGVRLLLGSTANAVLHGTRHPVLAVRVPGEGVEVPPAESKYRRIIAAVDLSGESAQVLDAAQAVAEREHAELQVAHVIKPFNHTYAGITPGALGTVGLDFEAEADQQARAQLRATALERGLPVEAMRVRHGAPQVELHDLVESERADLLVVGTHGKHGAELLLGSVANAVLHGTRCDVLAVRIR